MGQLRNVSEHIQGWVKHFNRHVSSVCNFGLNLLPQPYELSLLALSWGKPSEFSIWKPGALIRLKVCDGSPRPVVWTVKPSLQHQWRDLLPRAKSHLQLNPLSQEYRGRNRFAWQKTLQQINTNSILKACHLFGELRQALVAYFVYGGSSSGVEQAFSKNAWLCYSRRNSMRPGTEEMIEKTAADSENYDEEQILALAQVVGPLTLVPVNMWQVALTRVWKGNCQTKTWTKTALVVLRLEIFSGRQQWLAMIQTKNTAALRNCMFQK